MTERATETGRPVEWLPPLKPGWTMRPLWSMFDRIKDVDHPGEQMLSVFRDYGVVAKDSRENLNQTAEDRSIYQLVHPGWLVTNRMKAWQGSVGISSLRGIVSGHYICFAPRHREDHRYLNWLFRSPPYTHAYALLSRGVRIGQVEIDNDDYRLLPVLLPPLQEQRAIADYLDRETARIDALIDEQKCLMEMLNERRDAVIVEATTKGISQSAALIKSGVEWLGDIPEGWSVKAIRRCGTLVTGSTPPTDVLSNFDEEANARQWVRPQDLSSKTEASAWLTADGWRQLRPIPAGSVLVGCIAYSLGSVGYLPNTATTNQQITSIIPAEDGRYLYYVMRAAKGELWAASQINRVPILNNQRLGAIRIPVPPLDEQGRIASYLDDQTAKIDSLIAETEKFIELSRERRVALITAAVAGQIDVRSEVA